MTNYSFSRFQAVIEDQRSQEITGTERPWRSKEVTSLI